MIKSNSQKTPITWLLLAWFASICTLGPNLLSKVYYPPTARVVFSGLFASVILLVFTGHIKIYRLKLDWLSQIFFTGIFIYIVGLILASVFYGYAGFSWRNLISQSLRFLVLVIAIYSSDERLVKKYMNFYLNFIFILSFLSILLFFLHHLGNIQPLGIFVDTLSATRERVYDYYGIGLLESRARISASQDFLIQRAISFYDEPGTFGMMLLPGIFWSFFVVKNYVKLIILLLAFLLTFSVGSWLTLVFCLIFFDLSKILKLRKLKFNTYWLLLFATTILALLPTILSYIVSSELSGYDWLFEYFYRKFSAAQNGVTSATGRVLDFYRAFDLLTTHPLGLGANELVQDVGGPKAVGILGGIVKAGILGLFGFLMAYGGLLGMLLRLTRTKSRKNDTFHALSYTVLAMIIMSFQRVNFLDIYLGVFICGLFISSYLDSKEFELYHIVKTSKS